MTIELIMMLSSSILVLVLFVLLMILFVKKRDNKRVRKPLKVRNELQKIKAQIEEEPI